VNNRRLSRAGFEIGNDGYVGVCCHRLHDWRCRANQTAIYYAVGTDLDRLASSPQLEGFRARGVEVLLLTDQVDSFWVTSGLDFEGKPFKSVTQGLADLSLIALPEGEEPSAETTETVSAFVDFVKQTLGERQ